MGVSENYGVYNYKSIGVIGIGHYADLKGVRIVYVNSCPEIQLKPGNVNGGVEFRKDKTLAGVVIRIIIEVHAFVTIACVVVFVACVIRGVEIWIIGASET